MWKGSIFGQQQQQQPQQQQQQQQQQQPLQQSTLSSSTLGILGPSSNQNRSSLFASVSGSNVPKKRTLQERLQHIASGVIDPSQSELRVCLIGILRSSGHSSCSTNFDFVDHSVLCLLRCYCAEWTRTSMARRSVYEQAAV